MDFVPIRIENFSPPSEASGRNVHSTDRSQGEDQRQFDFFLSEVMNERSGTVRTRKSIDTKTRDRKLSKSDENAVVIGQKMGNAEGPNEIRRAKVINLKNLTEEDQTKLHQFLARIMESIKSDAKGKRILKAWEQGKIQLLIPVDFIQNETTKKQGLLLIQPDSKNHGNENLSALSMFSSNLLVGDFSGDKDSLSLLSESGTAGVFQVQNGQVRLKSFDTANGKIPLILFSDNEQAGEIPFTSANGKNEGRQNAAELIKASRLAAQRNTSKTAGSQEQKENPTTKLLYILKQQKTTSDQINQTASNNATTTTQGKIAVISEGQTLGKGLSGEIASLLESLEGEMKVRVSTKKGKIQVAANPTGRVSKGQVSRRATISQAQKKAALAVQQAKHAQQPDQESLFAGDRTKDFGKEFMRLDGNQLSEGQSTSLNQLMQKPVTEVFANGQPKAPLYQVIQKIEAMVQAAKAQRSSYQPQAMKAQLLLHPKHLGSLHLNLQYHDDVLSGTILAASKETKMLIEHSLPALKQALHAQHTTVNHLDVEVRSDLSQENAQNWFLQEHSNQQRRQSAWTAAEFQDNDIDALQVIPGQDLASAAHNSHFSGNGRLELYA